jgi:hypothetical protein
MMKETATAKAAGANRYFNSASDFRRLLKMEAVTRFSGTE